MNIPLPNSPESLAVKVANGQIPLRRACAPSGNRWLVIGKVGFWLSIHHMFFSFQRDRRYNLWPAV